MSEPTPDETTTTVLSHDETATSVSPDDVITVALIEDNRLVLEALTSLLNRSEHIRVVGAEPSERAVIDLIAEGMSNKAIGKELDISVHTVKSHLRSIMEKLTLHSRLQIANHVHSRDTDR